MIRRRSIGARTQILGALTAAIGIAVRIFGPGPVAEVPIDPHQFADVIVAMGLCMLAGGTLARLFGRN